MARKSKVVLENVELKPQVIGKTYKKKSNLLRVIFIFAIFILSVYYINDVSVYINNILGRDTADTISNPNNPDNDIENNDNNEQTNVEDTHYVVSDTLSFDFSALTLDNFKYENNILSFDINNNTNNQIDLSGRKIYLETYQQNNNIFLILF